MSELKKWKNKAWKVFSEYIRKRDANADGYVECCTCGKVAQWKGEGMQAGHFVPGRNNSVLYNDQLVHVQCSSCNYNNGEQFRYSVFMKKKYGYTDEQIEELLQLKNKTKRMTWQDHKEIYDLYKDYKNQWGD